MKDKIKVIIADDNKAILEYISTVLERCEKFEILDKVDNGETLVEKVVNLTPDLVITDVEMPNLTGIDAIAKINEQLENRPTYILITGNQNSELMEDANKVNIQKIITKPIINEEKFIEDIIHSVENVGNVSEPKQEVVIKYVKEVNPLKNFFKRLFHIK